MIKPSGDCKPKLVPRLGIICMSAKGDYFWMFALPLKGVNTDHKWGDSGLITQPSSQAGQKFGSLLNHLNLIWFILRRDQFQPQIHNLGNLLSPPQMLYSFFFLKHLLKLGQLVLVIRVTRFVRVQEMSRCLCVAARTQRWSCHLGLTRVTKFPQLYTQHQNPLL